ncbi:MAG: VOC family protein [Alphaproteobacteria bacterium]|nr:VOC family protein [Alphaproteobacteria bacterium]
MTRGATVFRNHVVGWGFRVWGWSVRARRRIARLGRPRLGPLEHITIPVRDLEVARRFYCDVLGGAYLMTVDDEAFRRFGRPPAENNGEGAYHVSIYMGGATRLDLFLQGSGQPAATAGHPHIAFRVSPRAMQEWQRLFDLRAIPYDGPIQLGPPGQASLYFNDPFGNHLEMTCFGFSEPIPVRPPSMASLQWRG